MSWLHTWSGLIFGWALFAMFLTGTLAFFRPEITRWMQPEIQVRPAPAQQAVATAQRYLSEHAVDAKRWFITPPTDREPLILLLYQTPKPKPGERGFVRVKLDPQTGQAVTARETRGGDSSTASTSSWRSAFPGDAGWPASRACSCWWPSSAASSRTRRSLPISSPFVRRRADSAPGWTANALSVLGLPFHLMITFSGLVLFMGMLMPAGILAVYDDARQFSDEVFASFKVTPPRPRPRPDRSRALGGAGRATGRGNVGRVTVNNPAMPAPP